MRKRCYMLPIAALLLASCSSSEDIAGNQEPMSQDYIMLRPMTTGATRGTVITATNFREFFVRTSAVPSETDPVPDGFTTYTNYVKSNDGTVWNTYSDAAGTTSDRRLWPKTGSLQFSAHSPIDLVDHYSVKDFPADQEDVMVAYEIGSKALNGITGVPLYFRHVMSQIAIQATNMDTENYEVKVLGVKLVNLNGKGTYAKNWYANQDAIGAANHYDPTKPVKDPNGLNGYTTWYDLSGNINTMATMNPVGLLAAKKDEADAYRFIGNAQFDYKIHGFEDLRLNLNLGLDWAKSGGVTTLKQGSEASWHNTNQSGGGLHTDYDYARRNTTLEFYADYNKTFAEKHNVDLMAGYSWQHFYNESSSKSVRLSDNASLGNSVGKGELYLISFFGRANYSFADRYLLTATLRADGTSRFQNHKWGIFPSVALGWNVMNEPFMENAKNLSTLKLRLSWGETGQQEVGGYYDTFAQFLTAQQGSYYFANGGNYTTPIVALGYSADLRWETTTTYNAGLDLGFWNDRLRAGIDLYKRDTRDILNFIPVPALSNLTNYLNTNIGSMTNMGVEVDLNAVLVETRDMSWTFGVNAAYNRNRITKLTVSSEDATGVETGGISGGTGNNVQMFQVGYPMRTFNLYQQVYDTAGNPVNGVYVDRNNDGQINADDKYLGHHADPDYTIGFNTSFSYKNWTAALSGHASIGNWVYNNVASDTEMLADLWTNQFVSNRVATAPNSMFSQAQYLSDYYLQDGSFLKLDNFTLGYTFPKLFHVTADRPFSLNLFGTVQNIWTLTRYTGIDPEIYGGIDGTVYPRPRTFVLGVKVNL